MGFLEKLREKPNHVKKSIFLLVMTITSVVLFFYLIVSIGGSFKNLAKEDSDKNKELPGLFDSMSASLEDVFNSKNVKLK